VPVRRYLPSAIAIAYLLATSAFAADQTVLSELRPVTDQPPELPAYLRPAIESNSGHKVTALPHSIGAIAASPVFKAPIAPPPPTWLWTGFYVGVHVGGAAGSADFADPFGPSIFGDTVRTPGFLGGVQAGFNWQAPNSPWVLGIQADISGFDSEGTNTCFASSGSTINATCRVRPQLAGTLTGRVGYAADPHGRTLLYVKGGLALAESHVEMATNNLAAGLMVGPAITSNSSNIGMWGGTVGAGVEYALTPAWSVFAEYDYLGFTSRNVANLGSVTVSPIGVITGAIPPGSSGVTQNIQEFKLGLNYKLGADPWAPAADLPPARLYPVGGYHWAPGWEFETGVRYMYSWGQFHKDLGQPVSSGLPTTSSISRLTYDDLRTNSGEFFLRFDTPWNLFVKGFIGGGRTISGHMNDEDFGLTPFFPFAPFIPYSNTLSGNVTGNTGYGVIDAGYDFFRGLTYKVGAFIGYTQIHQVMNAYGCVQIANPFSDCNPPVSTSVLGITENDTWIAMRVGMNAEAMVTDRIRVGADVAWLP
jgi:opacity protein-like surface antigen